MNDLSLVSLYTGAGGLDYGLELAGFRTRAGVDMDADSCASIEANRAWPMVHNDIHDPGVAPDMMSKGDLRPGEVHLLAGGPPCQPFSKSGYWVNGDTRRLDDPRAGTLRRYMECVEAFLPEVFLLENVHGINYSGKEEGFHLIARMTREINERHGTEYRTDSWAVLSAADFGVPQIRQRFFLVSHRGGRPFRFPDPTHANGATQTGLFSEAPQWKHVTAWDAIGGIEPGPEEDLAVRGQWADLLPSIPEGENYLWHTNRKGGLPLFGWRTRYWSFLLKLAKARPAWTIQAQPGPAIGPFHWSNRLLSVEELARLQTFPHGLTFVGSRGSVQRQIGNAVPSLLAEVLGRAIGEQLFERTYAKPPQLTVPPRRPIPAPEPVQPVPAKYFHLVGDHPDHP